MGALAVARQIRRLLGSRSGAARQDVLVAADIDAASGEETDFEARAALRKAKKRGGAKGGEGGDARRSGNKVEEAGLALNGLNWRAGNRNRRVSCNREYHLTQECPLGGRP